MTKSASVMSVPSPKLDELLKIEPPSEPVDFDNFWQATRREFAAQPLELTQTELLSPSPEHRLFEIYFKTLDGVRVGAWLVLPRSQPVKLGAVIGHGYGARTEPEFPQRSMATLFVNAPGFSLSAAPEIPDTADQHVLHGIAQRETYILRHCVTALWSGAQALAQLVPAVAENIVYYGCSFGGGLGAMALPWEPLYQRAYLEVPTFGHHPLRLSIAGIGRGEIVRQYAQTHPEVRKVLPYFDAATAARRIRIPVFVAPALTDAVVPPPGQFAVLNALSGPKEMFILTAGHADYPEAAAERRQLDERLERFLWSTAPHWK